MVCWREPDALVRALAPLPRGFAAAFVVLQLPARTGDTDPTPLLRAGTALDVRPAEDGLPLQPGVVHVAPPGRHTVVLAGTPALLGVSGALPQRPAGDSLLTSLAVSVGPATVAVLLGGGRDDGPAGARSVRRVGGSVITVERDPMGDDAVDFVVEVDTVADLLTRLSNGRRT